MSSLWRSSVQVVTGEAGVGLDDDVAQALLCSSIRRQRRCEQRVLFYRS
jgi:hypothetical protein